MLTRVTFILNDTCNQCCEYCYERRDVITEKQLSISTISIFLHFLNENFKFDNNSMLEILGGEPSLYNNWSQLVNIINNTNFSNVTIFTNGTKYIPELKLITHPNLKIKIALNTSNTNVVDRYIDDGLNVVEYYIVDRLNIYKRPRHKQFVLSEYTGNKATDLTYDDVYSLSLNLLLNGEDPPLGLYYTAKAMIGDMNFGEKTCCLPFKEEIAIRYDDKIVPCSRAKGLPLEVDILSENKMNEILTISNKTVNINNLGVVENGNNCMECPLSLSCQPCLMIKNDTIITNNGYIHSARKCQHEIQMCKAQIDALKDFRKIRGE